VLRRHPGPAACLPPASAYRRNPRVCVMHRVGIPASEWQLANGRRPGVSGRRAARRQALFLLYQWDLTGQQLASLFEGDPDDFAFALAEAVAARAPTLDARITAASPDWPADRLGTLERNILRVGVYELE